MTADLVKDLNTKLGGDVFFLGSDPKWATRVIPTGIMPMDDLLGGGVPRGRWTELFGDYSSMKSYVGYSTIAQAQQMGLNAALIDTEHAYDPEWLEHLGVDISKLRLAQPETAEEAVDAMEVCIRDNFGLIFVDSVAAMAPQDEVNKRESGENHQPARLAALLSRGARKLTSANTSTAILYANQTRMNIGITFGSRISTPGGRALPFYASHRISMRKGGKVYSDSWTIRDGKLEKVRTVVATKVIADLEKSKLTAPATQVWFTFEHDLGEIDLVGYLIAKAYEHGAITQASKGYYQIDGKGSKLQMKRLRAAVESDAALMTRLGAL